MGMSVSVLLFQTVLIMWIGDKHAKGAITVKFDMNSNNWAKGYQAFINWIKDRVDNKFIIK